MMHVNLKDLKIARVLLSSFLFLILVPSVYSQAWEIFQIPTSSTSTASATPDTIKNLDYSGNSVDLSGNSFATATESPIVINGASAAAPESAIELSENPALLATQVLVHRVLLIRIAHQ